MASAATASGQDRLAWLGVASLVGLGIAARLSPFLDPAGRLFRQFPTEDGYLMLTIARNLGLGLGMSISEGTIPTNGTQPLATLLYAVCFWLVGGERGTAVTLVLLLQVGIAVGAAMVLYRLARAVLGEDPRAPWLAAAAAALWLAAPFGIRHTMNCLETGLYVLCGLTAMLLVIRAAQRPAPAYGAWARAGAMLGVAFWARNDAVLLCGAVGLVHLLGWSAARVSSLATRFAELSVAGTMALLVALPWLVHNALRFGNVVPVSGQSESMHVSFGATLGLLPAKLVEYLLVVIPIPAPLEHWVPFRVVCTLGILAVAVTLCRARPEPGSRRALLAIGGLYTLALCVFYGLFFGAGHFMSRYLFPISPLLTLLLVVAVSPTLPRLPRAVKAVAALAILLVLGAYAVRVYSLGRQHEHGQVVDWVDANVPPQVWVGAIQTGTLGFFHDRTINLDGKVNPVALERRRRNEIPAYVVESEIDFLVDWVGIAGWMDKPPIGDHFELLVEDPSRNLAVLRRRTPRGLLSPSSSEP